MEYACDDLCSETQCHCPCTCGECDKKEEVKSKCPKQVPKCCGCGVDVKARIKTFEEKAVVDDSGCNSKCDKLTKWTACKDQVKCNIYVLNQL